MRSPSRTAAPREHSPAGPRASRGGRCEGFRPIDGPERSLLVAVLTDAAAALQDFSAAWPRWGTIPTERQRRLFDGAALALSWMHAEPEVNARGFTFAYLAEMLGLEPDLFRLKLFKLLDPAALDAIRNPERAFPTTKPKAKVRITKQMVAIARETPAWLETLPAEYREGILAALQAEALASPPRPELPDVRADSRAEGPARPEGSEGREQEEPAEWDQHSPAADALPSVSAEVNEATTRP